MSDLKHTLEQLLDGQDPQHAVLHNCLLLAGPVTSYGRDAILELFRTGTASTPTHFAQSRSNAALFATIESRPLALFADRYGTYVSRLWYLAQTPLSQSPAMRLDVPFDHQFGAFTGTGFEAEVHPDLDHDHIERVRALLAGFDLSALERATGSAIAGKLSQPYVNVIRALSDGEMTVLLLMVTALRNDGLPALLQFPVAVCAVSDSPADTHWAVDSARISADLARSWNSEL
jgi:hypothetical protein